MLTLTLSTTARDEMIDITSRLAAMTPPDLTEGLCQVFCLHTTAGLTINENCDPDVRCDLIRKLDRLIAWNSPEFHHAEGNSAAHLKASLLGFSQLIPVQNGRLRLGRWQGVYFCEFDGPRQRTLTVQFIAARPGNVPARGKDEL
ncbi:MAG: secondary thiamine-phosphate synthase enzyme YjbQ [Victivallales bacterium]|nr:secondary thiamine-phosphate synthase enzyme YjbQ [Victivallales bacterium]